MSAHLDRTDALAGGVSKLVRLIGYQIVEKMTVAEGAPILRRLGLTHMEIADIFQSTPGAVSVRLAESKRKKKK